jgi:hypothetical protein
MEKRPLTGPAAQTSDLIFGTERLHGPKYPFISITTSVADGPALYTLIPPEPDPAGTIAALATTRAS